MGFEVGYDREGINDNFEVDGAFCFAGLGGMGLIGCEKKGRIRRREGGGVLLQSGKIRSGQTGAGQGHLC